MDLKGQGGDPYGRLFMDPNELVLNSHSLCRVAFQGKFVYPGSLHHNGVKPAPQWSMIVCLGPRPLANFPAALSNPSTEGFEELIPPLPPICKNEICELFLCRELNPGHLHERWNCYPVNHKAIPVVKV